MVPRYIDVNDYDPGREPARPRDVNNLFFDKRSGVRYTVFHKSSTGYGQKS